MLKVLFGSEVKYDILLVLAEKQESYALEMARNLNRKVSVVQTHLYNLEKADILKSRRIGKTRLFRFNKKYFCAAEIRKLLKKGLKARPVSAVSS